MSKCPRPRQNMARGCVWWRSQTRDHRVRRAGPLCILAEEAAQSNPDSARATALRPHILAEEAAQSNPDELLLLKLARRILAEEAAQSNPDLLMYVLLGTMANSANCRKQSQETNLDVQDRDRGEWFSLGHLSWGNRNVLKSHRLYPGPSALQILAGLSFDISCGRHTMSDTSILSHFGL